MQVEGHSRVGAVRLHPLPSRKLWAAIAAQGKMFSSNRKKRRTSIFLTGAILIQASN
jgi:hypothetical protein